MSDQNFNNDGIEIAELETILKSYRFTPGDRFYRLTASVPWQPTATQPRRKTRLPLRLAFAVIGLLFFIVVILLFTPAGKSLADVFSRFFRFASSERMVETIPEGPFPTHIPDYPYSVYTLTVAEAEAAAGFDVKVPHGLEDEWQFHGARYEEDNLEVSLLYTYPSTKLENPSGQPAIWMYIKQFDGDFDSQQDWWGACPNGTLFKAEVNGSPAELLDGAFWVTYTRPEPGIQREWECEKGEDNMAMILRWQEETLKYQVSVTQFADPVILNQQDLIEIAESLR